MTTRFSKQSPARTRSRGAISVETSDDDDDTPSKAKQMRALGAGLAPFVFQPHIRHRMRKSWKNFTARFNALSAPTKYVSQTTPPSFSKLLNRS